MKKLFLALFIILCGYAFVQADNDSGGWDTTGGGSGDITTAAVSDSLDSTRVEWRSDIADSSDSMRTEIRDSATVVYTDSIPTIRSEIADKLDETAFGDSLANNHNSIDVDTVFVGAGGVRSTVDVYWDLYNALEVDSLAANGDSINVWSRPVFTTAEKDTSWRLLLQGIGAAGDDSLILGNTGYATVDQSDSVAIWLASSDTTNGRIDLLVTNSNGDTVFYDYDIVLTGMATMTEYKVAAFGAETFDANERYCVIIKVYIDTGDWAIIGKARAW